MQSILEQYLITFGWALTGAISVALSLGIALKVFDWLTPINEWEEIKKGNMGVAMILSALILGTALVIGLTIMPS
ncbi:DUF350 domain-containing protein [Candidatus Parcubacteria bacterium]|nr:DUF350 domain-containing protein [Candidatus Parcubacteria bacterium]